MLKKTLYNIFKRSNKKRIKNYGLSRKLAKTRNVRMIYRIFEIIIVVFFELSTIMCL